MPPKFLDVAMDIDSLKQVGHRFGTGAIMVFDQHTCILGATLNLINYFARESCGFCTPCRQGLPYIQDLLQRLENGEGKKISSPGSGRWPAIWTRPTAPSPRGRGARQGHVAVFRSRSARAHHSEEVSV